MVDENANGVIDRSGTDEITKTETIYTWDGTRAWREAVVSAYESDGNQNIRTVRKTAERVRAETPSISEVNEYTYVGNAGAVERVKRETRILSTSGKQYEEQNTRYDAIGTVSGLVARKVYLNGLFVADYTHSIATPTYMNYDGLGRLISTQDARVAAGVKTTIAYYQPSEIGTSGAYVGQRKTITDPLNHTTTYTYYRNEAWHSSPAGALMTQTDANAKTSHYAYDRLGRTLLQWGTAEYPVKYVYDPGDGTRIYDQLEEMHTYRSGSWSTAPASGAAYPSGFNSAGDKTTWTWHDGSGLLVGKADAANFATTYTYHTGTTLVNTVVRPRTGTTNATTTVSYDGVGRTAGRTYSDTTPPVTYTYTRDGRVATVADAAGLNTVTETSNGSSRTLQEAITGTGALSGVTASRVVDGFRRQTSFAAVKGAVTLASASYGYASDARLQTVTDNTGSTFNASYVYLANSDLVYDVALKLSTTTKLTQQRRHHASKDLLTLASNVTTGVVTSHSYDTFDNEDRRTKATREDGTYWSYGYNDRGEVNSAALKNSGNATLPGWSESHTYDEAGNMTLRGGDGGNPSYTPNNLNQNASVGHSGPYYYVVRGRAPIPSTPVVTVDSAPQSVTKLNAGTFDYFRSGVSASGPNDNLVAVTSGADTGSWVTYVPPASYVPTYDKSGNLNTDWRWIYTWDAENRLVKMQTQAAASAAGIPNYVIDFVYDHMGRRVRKTVKIGTSPYSDLKFVYDGWNLVAELDAASSDALKRSYVWGLDVSGTMRGAGGVGGLLMIRKHGTGASNQLVCYDGNGNITALVNAATSVVTAQYMHDPFGRKCRAYGSFVADNPFGFSTKYEDIESGLLYYGYRFYDPNDGRWLSRDPIGEEGGLNLYGFLGNDGVNGWDYLGLEGNFEVKHVPVQVGTSQQIQADGAESLDGFEVSYIEPKEGSSCDCTIILAQAISNDGFTVGTDPHFDNFDTKYRDKSKKADGGLAPPNYGGRDGQGMIALQDAPYIAKDANITSYVEVCALCVADEKDKRTTYTVLGCVRFDFSHKTRKTTAKPPSKATALKAISGWEAPAYDTPTKHWKSAVKVWKSMK